MGEAEVVLEVELDPDEVAQRTRQPVVVAALIGHVVVLDLPERGVEVRVGRVLQHVAGLEGGQGQHGVVGLVQPADLLANRQLLVLVDRLRPRPALLRPRHVSHELSVGARRDPVQPSAVELHALAIEVALPVTEPALARGGVQGAIGAAAVTELVEHQLQVDVAGGVGIGVLDRHRHQGLGGGAHVALHHLAVAPALDEVPPGLGRVLTPPPFVAAGDEAEELGLEEADVVQGESQPLVELRRDGAKLFDRARALAREADRLAAVPGGEAGGRGGLEVVEHGSVRRVALLVVDGIPAHLVVEVVVEGRVEAVAVLAGQADLLDLELDAVVAGAPRRVCVVAEGLGAAEGHELEVDRIGAEPCQLGGEMSVNVRGAALGEGAGVVARPGVVGVADDLHPQPFARCGVCLGGVGELPRHGLELLRVGRLYPVIGNVLRREKEARLVVRGVGREVDLLGRSEERSRTPHQSSGGVGRYRDVGVLGGRHASDLDVAVVVRALGGIEQLHDEAALDQLVSGGQPGDAGAEDRYRGSARCLGPLRCGLVALRLRSLPAVAGVAPLLLGRSAHPGLSLDVVEVAAAALGFIPLHDRPRLSGVTAIPMRPSVGARARLASG